MPYRLSPEQAVYGIRFQPIFSLLEKSIKAWEILSLLRPELQHERYFSSQSDDVSLNILIWQLQTVHKMKNRRRYYFNIPAKLLCRSNVLERIVAYLRAGIVIEIQDPHNLFPLSFTEQQMFYQHVKEIQSTRAEVWLDDVLPEYIPLLNENFRRFDGAKIDKSVLHHASHEPNILPMLIEYCRTQVKFVLIEGVENSQHFTTAAETGCHYLQGFMWPEERYSLRYKAVSHD